MGITKDSLGIYGYIIIILPSIQFQKSDTEFRFYLLFCVNVLLPIGILPFETSLPFGAKLKRR